MSESVQVVEKTADRVAVLIPPFHSFALGISLAAALALVVAVILKNAPSAARLLLGGVCLVLLVLAFYVNTSSTLLVLSRQQHVLLIEHRAFGFETSRQSYPLDDVLGFDLYTSRTTKATAHDIGVELKSGRRFSVSGTATNRAGYGAAVDALNGFLGE